MDLNLVPTTLFEELRYYRKGESKITGDNFSLLGFKDNIPVVTSHLNVSKPRGQIKIIRKLPPAVNVSKLEIDETGDQFINLNGQKLKVVPQHHIPDEVRKRTTMVLKQQMANIGWGLHKTPFQVRVISNSTQGSNADTLQLAKIQSADKFLTNNPDKPITIQGMKKIKLITTKLQKLTPSNQVIQTENSAVSSLSVNPTPTVVQGNFEPGIDFGQQVENEVGELLLNEDSKQQLNIAKCVQGGIKREKLLCSKTINILNQVKMQALNLSKKKIEETPVEPEKKIVAVTEIGVQTDECEKVSFAVQTDNQQILNLLDLELDNLLDITDLKGESPIISDVNFGIGPSMGKFVKCEVNPSGIQTSVSGSTSEHMEHDGKQVQNDLIKKQLMFFKDLRECLTPNATGNLPIHEGVINNDVGMVKRHCTALKARKAGVNLENHNGCFPLQLAIINDASVEIVKTLLEHGADIREADGEGNNILHLAAKFGRFSILELLLNHENLTPCFDCINSFNFEGLTPLMICCIANWTVGAQLFIARGANVNLKDQTSGRTALFHASEAQNVDIVRILLNNKADPKIKNFFGTSPHDAMYELEDMSEMIKCLIFGRSKKRTIEAEMNPVKTAKAAKCLKTFSKLQKIDHKNGVPIRYKMQRQIK